MRKQSETYAPFPAVRRVDVQATIDISEDTLQVSRYTNQSGSQDASKYGNAFSIDQIIGKREAPTHRLASLSRDGWVLDNKTAVLSGNDDQTRMRAGVWLSESGNDGEYETATNGGYSKTPYIRLRFETVPDIPGWTLIWDKDNGTYPTKISVSHGLVQDTPQIIEVKGYQQVVLFRPESASVQFEFLQTNVPNARPRLLGIIFGVRETFDKDTIKNIKVTYGTDPACESLPYSKLTMTIDNSDHRYNMLNPDGIYHLLQEGQAINLKFIIGEEAVDMGAFGFVKAEARDDALTAEIVAADPIYVMDTEMIDGSDLHARPMWECVSKIIGGSSGSSVGGTSAATKYPTDLGDLLILMPPGRISRREALRRVAQAVGCTVWHDRDHVFVFKKLDAASNVVGEITKNEMYSLDSISVTERVESVELTTRDVAFESKETHIYGDGSYAKQITNESVAPTRTDEIGEWLLKIYRERRRYAVKNRCDPAIEIGDTVRIEDAYGNNDNVVVTGIEITYDGGLSAVTKGVGS